MSESRSTDHTLTDELPTDVHEEFGTRDGSDAWYTEDELAALGYRREALAELFGQATDGPDGLVGWTAELVAEVEHVRLAPAFDLLEMAFDNHELGDLPTS